MKKIIFSILFSIVLLCFYINNSLCTVEEKNFSVKGNDKVEFVAKIKNCGATSDYIYKLYLIPKNGKLNFFNKAIFEAEDYLPIIKWHKNHFIIETNSTRVHSFTNFKWIDNNEYLIQLKSP